MGLSSFDAHGSCARWRRRRYPKRSHSTDPRRLRWGGILALDEENLLGSPGEFFASGGGWLAERRAGHCGPDRATVASGRRCGCAEAAASTPTLSMRGKTRALSGGYNFTSRFAQVDTAATRTFNKRPRKTKLPRTYMCHLLFRHGATQTYSV